MKPADIANQRVPGRPTVSPDGRFVVVSVANPDLDADDYTAQLWIMSADGTSPPRRLTHGWRDGVPRFSPDGRWLAFLRTVRDGAGVLARPQLYVLPTDGGEARRLTGHPLGAGEPVWSPDSTRIAYSARVPEEGRYGTKDGVGPEGEPPRRITKLFYRVDNVGFLLDKPQQVFVVDALATDAEPIQLTEGPFESEGVSFSPDGRLLTFASARHETWNDDLVVDVWVCGVDGSGVRRLTDGTMAAGQPRFTPDGTAVCFHGTLAAGPVISNQSLWRVPLDDRGGAAATRLTDPVRHNLAHGTGRIDPHASGVLFTNDNRGAVELISVPYDGGEPTVLVGGECQVRGYDLGGGTLAASVADPGSWGEVYVYRVCDGASGVDAGRRLSDFNADVTSLPMEEITASAPDGYPVHGWVVRPAGAGPHPVLLLIHGGPFGQYGWELFDEAQVYAEAGYAVVMGNPRGSSGYGEPHGRAVLGDVGAVSERDLMALLDQALKSDDLDGSRAGVLGGSHGGFMTTWLAAHQGHRFKAAVSERAVNAIDSFAGSSDVGWFFGDALWGSDPAQSPLSHADRITMPVLIIHSEQDWRCPLEQAQRLFVALKRRGTPVEMVLFPGEGHEMSRAGKPSHRVARFEAILEWFQRWV